MLLSHTDKDSMVIGQKLASRLIQKDRELRNKLISTVTEFLTKRSKP